MRCIILVTEKKNYNAKLDVHIIRVYQNFYFLVRNDSFLAIYLSNEVYLDAALGLDLTKGNVIIVNFITKLFLHFVGQILWCFVYVTSVVA